MTESPENNFKCRGCGHRWRFAPEADPFPCPKCGVSLVNLHAGTDAQMHVDDKGYGGLGYGHTDGPATGLSGPPKRVLALVTARGGSKRLPGKNLQTIQGVSLVRRAWGILNLMRHIHPEMDLRLSTDSPEIAAEWPEADRPTDLRPEHLSADDTKSIDVALYELCRLGEPVYDAVLLLQPTSPLVNIEDLEGLWDLVAKGKPSALGVVRTSKPSAWTMSLKYMQGYLTDGIANTPSRDENSDSHANEYVPMGIYMATTAFLRARRAFFHCHGDSWPVFVPPERAVDIDTQMDLDLACMLADQADTMLHNTVTTDCL